MERYLIDKLVSIFGNHADWWDLESLNDVSNTVTKMINAETEKDKQILYSTKDIGEYEDLDYHVILDIESYTITKIIDFTDWEYRENEVIAHDCCKFICILDEFLDFDGLYELEAMPEDILKRYRHYKTIKKFNERYNKSIYKEIIENNINIITEEEAEEEINIHVSKMKYTNIKEAYYLIYIMKEDKNDDVFVAVDNSYNECYMEEFNNVEIAIGYLLTDLDVVQAYYYDDVLSKLDKNAEDNTIKELKRIISDLIQNVNEEIDYCLNLRKG